jgi:hypothetical protein
MSSLDDKSATTSNVANLIRNCELIISISQFAEEKRHKDCEYAFNRYVEAAKKLIKSIPESEDKSWHSLYEFVEYDISHTDILEIAKAVFHTLKDVTPLDFLVNDLAKNIISEDETNWETKAKLSDRLAESIIDKLEAENIVPINLW